MSSVLIDFWKQMHFHQNKSLFCPLPIIILFGNSYSSLIQFSYGNSQWRCVCAEKKISIAFVNCQLTETFGCCILLFHSVGACTYFKVSRLWHSAVGSSATLKAQKTISGQCITIVLLHSTIVLTRWKSCQGEPPAIGHRWPGEFDEWHLSTTLCFWSDCKVHRLGT